MTSGTAKTFLLPLLIATLTSNASTLDPETLIASMARPVPAITRYTEVHFDAMLNQPLLLHGELSFRGSGDLEKRVDAPYRETTTIHGDEVEIKRDGKPNKHFSLKRAPQLKGLLVSFSALLTGDTASLKQFYTVDSDGDDRAWQLHLTPRDPALRKQVESIIVSGSAHTLHCFVAHEADGDANVLLIEDLAAATLPNPLTLAALSALCQRADMPK